MNITIVIQTLIYGYLFLLIFASLGYAFIAIYDRVTKQWVRQKYFTPGLTLFTGLIFFITIYSIIKTTGNTIFLVNLLIFALLFIVGRKESKNHQGIQKDLKIHNVPGITKFLLNLTIFYLFLCGFIFLHLPDFSGTNWIATPASDYIWYIDIVEGLKKAGTENLQGSYNFFNNTWQLREPYHYFELWMAAGFSEITGISAFYSFLIFPFLVIGVIIMFILTDIFKLFSDNKVWIWIIPLAVFLGPLKYFEIVQAGDMYQILPFPVPKYQLFQLFLLIFFYLVVKNKKTAFIFILFLPVASFSAFIPVGGALGIITIVDYWKKRKLIDSLKFLLPAIIIFITILLYYQVNHWLFPDFRQFTSDTKIASLTSDIRTKFNILAASGFIILFFLPLIISILILLEFKWKKIISIINIPSFDFVLFTIAGSFSGLLGWLLFYSTMNSSQIFQNFVVPGMTVLFTVLFFKTISLSPSYNILSKVSGYILFFTLCFFGFISTFNTKIYYHAFSATQKFQKDFLDKTTNLLANEDQHLLIATGNTDSYYLNKFNRAEKVYSPCLPIKIKYPSVIPLSITSDLALRPGITHLYDDDLRDIVMQSPFIMYLKGKNINLLDSLKIDSCRLAFIKDYKIKYFAAGKGYDMTPILNSYSISDSCIDSYSGIRFYKFKLN